MMRISLHAALLTASMMICVIVVLAQSPTATAQNIESMRGELIDLQAQEAELQAREKQLDEDLRPENIERSLALNGSTRPEELREQRRRQLEAEKTRVRAQLDTLATNRARLEAAIATADAAEAARQSITTAVITNTAPLANTNGATVASTARVRQPARTRHKRSVRHRRRSLQRRHRF